MYVVHEVVFTAEALRTLARISDRRVRALIVERAEGLSQEPEKQGNPLTAELAGYRSIRAVGQRYRIVYSIDQGKVRVLIIAVGIRRQGDRHDVYSLAQRLVQLGLTEFSE